MPRRKTELVDLTSGGKPLVGMFFAPTRDKGISLGFTHPSFQNAHFTVFESPRDGRIHSHVSINGGKRHPWSQQIDSAILERFVAKTLTRWRVPRTAIPRVYVMRERLARKLLARIPQMDGRGRGSFPLELSTARIRADLWNPVRWKRISPHSLGVENPRMGFARIRKQVRHVEIVPGDSQYCWIYSDRQWWNFANGLMRLVGFQDFLEYIESEKLGEDVWKAGRKLVASQGTRRERRRPV